MGIPKTWTELSRHVGGSVSLVLHKFPFLPLLFDQCSSSPWLSPAGKQHLSEDTDVFEDPLQTNYVAAESTGKSLTVSELLSSCASEVHSGAAGQFELHSGQWMSHVQLTLWLDSHLPESAAGTLTCCTPDERIRFVDIAFFHVSSALFSPISQSDSSRLLHIDWYQNDSSSADWSRVKTDLFIYYFSKQVLSKVPIEIMTSIRQTF